MEPLLPIQDTHFTTAYKKFREWSEKKVFELAHQEIITRVFDKKHADYVETVHLDSTDILNKLGAESVSYTFKYKNKKATRATIISDDKYDIPLVAHITSCAKSDSQLSPATISKLPDCRNGISDEIKQVKLNVVIESESIEDKSNQEMLPLCVQTNPDDKEYDISLENITQTISNANSDSKSSVVERQTASKNEIIHTKTTAPKTLTVCADGGYQNKKIKRKLIKKERGRRNVNLVYPYRRNQDKKNKPADEIKLRRRR